MHLTFDQITFRYRRSGAPVYEAFSWEVPAGRTVLLGPNGAGKTTLLSLGTDALRPQAGNVRLGLLNPQHRSDQRGFRQAVGWMPQQVYPVPGLTCREQVAYAGWLKGMSRGEAWAGARVALERVAMAELGNKLTSELSGGQLRRIGLSQALVHRADVLLLDEPTAGLDPAQRTRFRETIVDLPADLTVVVSTHQVDDLSDLFDTVVIIDRGLIRYQGTVREFLNVAPAGADHRAEVAYTSLVSGER